MRDIGFHKKSNMGRKNFDVFTEPRNKKQNKKETKSRGTITPSIPVSTRLRFNVNQCWFNDEPQLCARWDVKQQNGEKSRFPFLASLVFYRYCIFTDKFITQHIGLYLFSFVNVCYHVRHNDGIHEHHHCTLTLQHSLLSLGLLHSASHWPDTPCEKCPGFLFLSKRVCKLIKKSVGLHSTL